MWPIELASVHGMKGMHLVPHPRQLDTFSRALPTLPQCRIAPEHCGKFKMVGSAPDPSTAAISQGKKWVGGRNVHSGGLT